MRTADKLLADFCVPLGHLQICMAHLALKGEQVTTIVQIEGCKAMPYLVGRKFNAVFTAILSEISVQSVCLQLISVTGREEPVLPHFGLDADELFEGIIYGIRQIQSSATAGFGDFWADVNGLGCGLVITVGKRYEFACSDPGIQNEKNDGVIS
jgi:hypothetical protein